MSKEDSRAKDNLLHINEAHWLKTMEYYPETLDEFKLLVTIFDKTGIFRNYDLTRIVSMDGNRLNILYAILRILNKIFNKYLDYVVKKIFKNRLEGIFICTDLTHYDLFIDQLIQDMDSFVCSQICLPSDIFHDTVVLGKLVEYLEKIFQKDFYQDICRKLKYQLNKDFLDKNNELLAVMVEDYIIYTKETLVESYLIMDHFLEKIFSQDCDDRIIIEMIAALEKHINLSELFREDCTELQIFYEYA